MGINLKTIDNIAKYAESQGVKSILQTKPFKGNIERLKLGHDNFSQNRICQKYFIMPAISKSDKREFSNLFVDSVLDFEKSNKKNPNSIFNKIISKANKILLNAINSVGWSREIIKDANGKLVGGFGFVKEANNIHIGQIAINPSKRNTKESKEILIELGKRIKEIAKENNKETITCDVVKQEKHLIRLYKKAGFTEAKGILDKKLCRLQANTKDLGGIYF